MVLGRGLGQHCDVTEAVAEEPTRLVRRGDVDLAVYESGDAARPTLLMVHGWPDTHHLWSGVTGLLADDFHLVSYDVRGHGRSTRPRADEAYLLDELSADLAAVAEAVSPEAPVHVLAHDWGSVQAWDAVCAPEAETRYASFTSISGPSIDHAGRWFRDGLSSPRRWPAMVAQLMSSLYIWWFISPLGPMVMRRWSMQRWERMLSRVEGIEPRPWHHGDTLADDMVQGLALYRANVLRRLRRPRERRTSVPVLQLVPTRDVAIRGASLRESERWAERTQRIEVPYGHWLPLSRPEVVAAEVTRFVSSLPSR